MYDEDAYLSWHSLEVVHFDLQGTKLSLEHCTQSHLIDSRGAWSSHLHPLFSPELVLELRTTQTCIHEHRQAGEQKMRGVIYLRKQQFPGSFMETDFKLCKNILILFRIKLVG